ncbi:MAG: hypothetical protein CMA62_05865 [Euryarchaeota archaeon]|nr:hypothetical protein [Euryarchaeota archaeon]
MQASPEDYRLTAIVMVVSATVTLLIVGAVSTNSVEMADMSAVAWCAVIIFGIQWLAWIPASILQSERFYDLTGGMTFLAAVVFSLWAGSQSDDPSTRELLVSAMAVIWSLRLSAFLFLRIHHSGKDGRFDQLKTSPIRFMVPWTLQALWVFLTLNVVLVINTQSGEAPPLGVWDGIGLALWLAGFSIEVLADSQKSAFNSKEENEGRWIDEGLWARSRHPNYFGEILLWTGTASFGVACFDGLEVVAWISPVFVYLLLTRVSGVPILDRRGLEKWGEDPDYLSYRETTPTLIPRLGSRR